MIDLKNKILIILFLLYPVIASGHYFKKIGKSEGLSGLTVMSICQDTLGRMWFGTNAGINIYDGNSIKAIKSYNTEHNGQKEKKFINGTIHQMIEGCEGRIYIRNNSSLLEFDVTKQKIREILPHGVRTMTLHRDTLSCILKDSLMTYSPHTRSFNFIRRLQTPTITCMQYHGKRLYIGTMKGLYLFEDGSLSPILEGVEIYRLFASSMNEIWIASRMNGLYRIKSDGTLVQERTSPERVASNQIREFIEDRHHNIWFGTFDGLQKYDPYNDTYTTYGQGGKNGTLEHHSVFSLYNDRQGTIWVGTYYGGINYFNQDSDMFAFYSGEHADGNGLNFPVVTQMTEDAERNLWIGTDGGGVNVLERNTSKFVYHTKGDGNSISHNNVKTLAYVPEKNCIFIGTYTGGLCRYDKDNGQFHHYLPQYKANTDSFPDWSIYHCMYNSGVLYVASHNGFWELDVAADRFTRISPYQFYNFTIGSNGDIWLVSEKEILIYNRSKKSMERFDKYRKAISGDVRVTHIITTKDGTIYFTTLGEGVFSYNTSTGYMERFTSLGNGLLSDFCYNLAETSMGNILITGEKGISIYSPFNRNIRAIELSGNKGMISAVLENSGIFVASDDCIYVGGVDGMISFRERELYNVYDNIYDNMYFSSLLINNGTVKPGDGSGILDKALPFVDRLELAYNQNNITLGFASSNYISLDRKTSFRYMLEGFDTDRISTDRYEIGYTNLPPGNYRLKVFESGYRLGYNYNKSISMDIRINRPWFASYGAIAAYFVILTSISFGIYRTRKSRRLLTASLAKEKEEKERIEEMNKIKLRFFTNISHEFRTPLTLIIGQIEQLMQNERYGQQTTKSLTIIKKNATKLRQLITELLDFRKQEQGFYKLKVEYTDIALLAKDVGTSFSELAAVRNIGYQSDCNEEIFLWIDPLQMQKVFYNLLSNAFKYTPDGGNIRLYIKKHSQSVEIGVCDTGCGIPEEALPHVFERFYQAGNSNDVKVSGSGIGLALTKSIIDSHHGKISVDSQPGKGSCFIVELKTGNRHFTQEELEHEPIEQAKVQPLDDYPEISPNVREQKPADAESEYDEDDIRPIVLLVEDEEDILSMLSEAFSPTYKVYKASNGQTGWEMANKVHPDIVVSDVMMPVMSGKDLCYKIKNSLELAYIPVVLLTAQSSEEQEIEGYMFGADEYITKPFSIKLLLARCSNLLSNRRLAITRTIEPVQENLSPEASALNQVDKKLLEQAMDIIIHNMDNPDFDVTVLASGLSMGRNKVFTRIKEATGLTPNEFIMKIKMNEALRMLQNDTQLNISEISYSLGFGSPRYFSRCFKAFYGVSPQSYRKSKDK